jgi:amino acid adenylation domain-containing protein
MTKRNSDAPLIRFLPEYWRVSAKESGSPVTALNRLDLEQLHALKSAASALSVSTEDFLLACYASLLARLTRQDNFSIRVVSGRTADFQLDNACTFEQVVAQASFPAASESITQAVNHSLVPSENSNENPSDEHLQSVSYEYRTPDSSAHRSSVNGLRLTVRDGGASLSLTVSSGIWTEEQLHGWLNYLLALTASACRNPSAPIAHLALWSSDEALRFYRELNRTEAIFAGPTSVAELFAEQARLHPESIAVHSGTRRYTYSELRLRSLELAHQLAAAGAGPGQAVAICMERSVDLLAALLAVLHSGAYYVPVDPHIPANRLRSIIEECRPVAILSDSAVADSVNEKLSPHAPPVLFADQPFPLSRSAAMPGVIRSPDDLAYTIYTSGTTGKPKGVQVTHRSLTNFIHAMSQAPGIRRSDRVLSVAPISFDIAAMDMFLPLCFGSELVIASRDEAMDPFRLARLLKEHDITLMQATPATWRMLVTTGWKGKRNLRTLSGGEALPRELADDLLHLGSELWNCYGPTETTIWSSVLRLKPEPGIVPVGPPIANTTFYVMDEAGQPVPQGVPGELYIGGLGVSPGYVNRPELTAQRFVPDPFSSIPGATLFRTGDLVRLRDGNEFEFFGRLDHQIKLRGFRIELGEIESVLRTHPHIKDAAAVLREDLPGEPHLVAYVLCAEKEFNPESLRKHAASFLPEYMLPSPIVRLDRLPLTPSGKLDRRSLPPPQSVTAGSQAGNPEAAAASDDLEARLLAIFREVLRNDSIGVTDSFFQFGGYSLLTVRLFARIDRDLHVRLPISLLFDAPTVRDLAHVIRRGISPSVIVPIRPFGSLAPLFVIHSYLLYSAMLEIVDSDRPVYGVREMGDGRDLQSVEERATRYVREILDTYSDGPLLLAGWCAAGSLTVEIARQLRAAGHAVGLVALFDAERPGYSPNRGPLGWIPRIGRRVAFHFLCLRNCSWPERLGYIASGFAHTWDWTVDSSVTTFYRFALWLKRTFGVRVSTVVLNTVYARLSDLQDSSIRPYPGRLELFRAADVPDITAPDKTLGWNAIAQEGVEVIFVPGDHESMFKKPNVHLLAQHLQWALKKSDSSAILA